MDYQTIALLGAAVAIALATKRWPQIIPFIRSVDRTAEQLAILLDKSAEPNSEIAKRAKAAGLDQAVEALRFHSWELSAREARAASGEDDTPRAMGLFADRWTPPMPEVKGAAPERSTGAQSLADMSDEFLASARGEGLEEGPGKENSPLPRKGYLAQFAVFCKKAELMVHNSGIKERLSPERDDEFDQFYINLIGIPRGVDTMNWQALQEILAARLLELEFWLETELRRVPAQNGGGGDPTEETKDEN